MARSEGDPRVLFVMNFVLSGMFATGLMGALATIRVTTFSWTKVALLTAILMVLTYYVTR